MSLDLSNSNLTFEFHSARNILGVEKDGKSDTYVTANCLRNGKDTQLFKSDPIMLTSHPQVRRPSSWQSSPLHACYH